MGKILLDVWNVVYPYVSIAVSSVYTFIYVIRSIYLMDLLKGSQIIFAAEP